MMLRQSLFLGAATMAAIGASYAQTRGQSRDDLLDALTRHIQICSELTDTQQRLSCYDRLQTQVGGVSAPAPSQPTPTPLQAAPPPPPPPSPPPQTTTGSSINTTPPLPTQPLAVPGGGVATLGGSSSGSAAPPSSSPAPDPNAAFDPRSATWRPPEAIGPKPQPQLRRTGPRPIPYSSTPQPLVVIGANNLTYGESRYWQVTVTLTSNTPRPVSAQAECTFMNAGRPVSTDYLGPLTIQPGEQITTELIGPPTATYVDSTNCRITNP
jgi:hypothetical protein